MSPNDKTKTISYRYLIQSKKISDLSCIIARPIHIRTRWITVSCAVTVTNSINAVLNNAVVTHWSLNALKWTGIFLRSSTSGITVASWSRPYLVVRLGFRLNSMKIWSFKQISPGSALSSSAHNSSHMEQNSRQKLFRPLVMPVKKQQVSFLSWVDETENSNQNRRLYAILNNGYCSMAL